MPIPYTDNFTNTNGTNIVTHNSDYVEDVGSAEIQSNSAQGSVSGQAWVRYTGGTPDNDQKTTGILSTTGAGGTDYAMLSVRGAVAGGVDNYVVLGNSSDDHWLYRTDNGVGTVLSAALTVWSDADKVEARAVGTTISAYLNDTLDDSVTDSTYSSGDPGIGFYANTANSRWNSATYANVTGALLAAASAMALNITAALATAITLGASVSLSASASADLSTGIELQAASSLSLSASADLLTPVELAAAPNLSLNATADLLTSLSLASATSLSLSATSDLLTAIELAATPSLSLAATADIATAVEMAAATTVSIATTADLAVGGAQLAATPNLSINTTADLNVGGAQLAATSNLTITTTADLLTAIDLAAAPALTLNATGDLLTSIPLAAAVDLSLMATCNLLTAIDLAADPDISISVSSNLTLGITPGGGQVLIIRDNLRILTVLQNMRALVVQSKKRTLNIPESTGITMFTKMDEKDPSDVDNFVFNWADRLAAGETIASYTITAPAGLTLDSDSNTTTTVTAVISGGIDGQSYDLLCEIVTNATPARTLQQTMTIPVADQ